MLLGKQYTTNNETSSNASLEMEGILSFQVHKVKLESSLKTGYVVFPPEASWARARDLTLTMRGATHLAIGMEENKYASV